MKYVNFSYLLALWFGFVGMLQATPLDGTARSIVILTESVSCIDESRKFPSLSDYTKAEISNYCVCRATKMADDLTMENFVRLNSERKNGIARDDIDRAILFCNQKFLRRPTTP